MVRVTSLVREFIHTHNCDARGCSLSEKDAAAVTVLYVTHQVLT